MADRHWRKLFYRGVGCFSYLGSDNSLAALFSGLDVHRDDLAGLAKKPLGIFYWDFRGGLWDYTGVFVNTFVANGVHELTRWIHTGHVARPDQFIAVPAWISNFLVVVGCVWAYSRRTQKKLVSDFGRFLLTFALITGFFALDMWICQPRYLPLFRHMLHPRWPF
jgi:hypothetical protein